jgi:ATP-dependent protease ClpP protease subunit
MYHNATFMIHEGLMFAYGHVAELKQAVAWLDKFNMAAADVYAEKSGKSVEEINAALLGPNGDGTYYSAAEAFSMGFVDEILTAGSSKKQKPKNETAKLQAMLNYRIAKSALTNRREPV